MARAFIAMLGAGVVMVLIALALDLAEVHVPGIGVVAAIVVVITGQRFRTRRSEPGQAERPGARTP